MIEEEIGPPDMGGSQGTNRVFCMGFVKDFCKDKAFQYESLQYKAETMSWHAVS